MKTAKSQRRRRLGLFGAVSALIVGATAAATGSAGVSLAAGSSTGGATTGKADYSVTLSPNRQSVQLGKSTAYTLTVTATNGFTGSVSLAAAVRTATGAAASGISVTISPPSLSMTTAGSVQTATVSAAAARSASLGERLIEVSATSGRAVKLSSAVLTVEKTPGALSVTASPSSVSVAPDEVGALTIALNRTGSMSDVPVTLGVTGAPEGTVPSFNPRITTGTGSSLQLKVPATARTGSYPLTISASVEGEPTQTASAVLNVVYNARSFDIRGDAVEALSPGATTALALQLTNPNNRSISITNISVVASTSKPGCTADNFRAKQYTGLYPLVLPAGTTRSLASLVEERYRAESDAATRAAWLPSLQMLNLDRNQDGCKAPTSVTLSYSGSGTGD